MVLLMPVLGLLIAGLAIGFGEATDKPQPSTVLFSGQNALGGLLSRRLGLVGRRAAPARRLQGRWPTRCR